MLTDGVAEVRGGAHFTANPPDYGRDEAFQKEYAAAANDPAEWADFAARYVMVPEDEYRASIDERRAS
jgi:glutaconate CoA-transferase subunit A